MDQATCPIFDRGFMDLPNLWVISPDYLSGISPISPVFTQITLRKAYIIYVCGIYVDIFTTWNLNLEFYFLTSMCATWMKTQICSCPTRVHMSASMCVFTVHVRVNEKVRQHERLSAALGFSCSDVPSCVFSQSFLSKNISRAQSKCVLFHYSDLAIDFPQTFVVQFGFEEEECLALIFALFLRTESLRRHWAADPVPPCSYHWEN